MQRRLPDRPRVRPPAGPTAGSVTDDDRRQPAKQYWPIMRASNKNIYDDNDDSQRGAPILTLSLKDWLSRVLYSCNEKVSAVANKRRDALSNSHCVVNYGRRAVAKSRINRLSSGLGTMIQREAPIF